MMKLFLNIMIILAISLFIGCKPRKSSEPAGTNTNKNTLQTSSPIWQTAPSPEQKNSIDANQTISIDTGTEINTSIDTNTPQPDSNDIKIPLAEPNVVKIPDTEPNQKTAIPEPNKSEPNTPQYISFYNKCADILNKYVDIAGRVDFQSLNRRRYDLRALLAEFAVIDPNTYKTWPKEDKIAFWINLYNLHTLNIINDNYPIESAPWERIFKWPSDSIRYIDQKVGGINKQKFFIMNEAFTLREIEERFLSQQFDTPAAFFALYHGGRSGPPLLNEPYTGKDLYKQLDYQVKRIIDNSINFEVNYENKTVNLPAILEPAWYGQYFTKSFAADKFFKDQKPPVAAVLNFLTNYLSEQQVKFLKLENYKVNFVSYDWRLKEKQSD